MTVRRIVTGVDGNGKSYVVTDGATTGSIDLGRLQADDIWVDDPAAPDPAAERDPVSGVLSLTPPVGGSTVRIVTFRPPGASDWPDDDAVAAARERWHTGHAMEALPPGEPAWHTTDTIDYGIILSGEVDLLLDDGATRCRAGDVVVQRRTRHAWKVVGDEPCRVAFVLISSENYR